MSGQAQQVNSSSYLDWLKDRVIQHHWSTRRQVHLKGYKEPFFGVPVLCLQGVHAQFWFSQSQFKQAVTSELFYTNADHWLNKASALKLTQRSSPAQLETLPGIQSPSHATYHLQDFIHSTMQAFRRKQANGAAAHPVTRYQLLALRKAMVYVQEHSFQICKISKKFLLDMDACLQSEGAPRLTGRRMEAIVACYNQDLIMSQENVDQQLLQVP